MNELTFLHFLDYLKFNYPLHITTRKLPHFLTFLFLYLHLEWTA
jgi:hypothetical protein